MSAVRQPVSAVVITLNAATQLEACLRSVAFCDEIVVVDSGSTDRTTDIAQSYGARVLQEEWRGFGRQKQFAVMCARYDWVLCIDADECVSERLRNSIEHALLSPSSKTYRFARCNGFMGRFLRHGEGYPDWSTRLFDRRHAGWSDDTVHERVIADCAAQPLIGDLLHYSAESLESYLAKQNRYTTVAAREAVAQGGRATILHLIASPTIRFIKFYFFRFGFVDGLPGLIHILIGCGNSLVKYAKMIELQARKVE